MKPPPPHHRPDRDPVSSDRGVGSEPPVIVSRAVSSQRSATPVMSSPPASAASNVDDVDQQLWQLAGPILAVERGFTNAFRVKLIAAALASGRTEPEVDRFLLRLNPNVTNSSPAGDRQVLRFRKYLQKKLKKLVTMVLPPDQEQRLLSIALKRYGLHEAQAKPCIVEMAESMGIRRLTSDDLAASFRQVVEGHLADATVADPELTHRLIHWGQGFGMQGGDVWEMIRGHLDANRLAQRRQRAWNALALASALVAVVGVGVGIGLVASRGGMRAASSSVDSGEDSASTWEGAADSSGHGHEVPSTPRSEERSPPLNAAGSVPDWWNAELSDSVARARRDTALASCVALIGESEPVRRAMSYDALIQYIQAHSRDAAADERLGTIVANAHALEPDESLAARMREGLGDMMLITRRELPAKDSDYALAFWSVEILIRSLHVRGQTPARALALSERLEKSLAISLSDQESTADQTRRCYRSLANLLYRQMIEAAASQPEQAAARYRALRELARACLDREEQERLNVDLLAAVLPTIGPVWIGCRELIEDCASAQSTGSVLRLVQLFESQKDAQLLEYIGSLLLARADIPERERKELREPAQVAEAVRARLMGVSGQAKPGDDRWRKLTDRLRGIRLDFRSEDEQDHLLHAVELVQLGTLAMAMAEGDASRATFDRLATRKTRTLREPPADSAGDERAMRAPGESPFPVDRERPRSRPELASQQVATLVQRLKNYEHHAPGQRAVMFQQLAGLMQNGETLNAEQGYRVARYLVATKGRDEIQTLDRSLPTVLRSPMVCLGIADQLTSATMSKNELGRLVSQVVARSVTGEELRGDCESIRREVLVKVLAEFEPSAEKKPVRSLGATEEVFRESYIERLRMIGLDGGGDKGDDAATQGCAWLIELWCKEAIAGLQSGASDKSERDSLARMAHEIEAIRSLSINDLQRTVMLQRVLLRTLAIQRARSQPDLATEVRGVLEWLDTRDSQSQYLFEQLQLGESALVRLWLTAVPDAYRDSAQKGKL